MKKLSLHSVEFWREIRSEHEQLDCDQHCHASRGRRHLTVWTGSEMIVRGGYSGGLTREHRCARYNPTSNSWTRNDHEPTPLMADSPTRPSGLVAR